MKDSLEMPDSAFGGTGEVDGAAILNASVDSAVALEPVMELNNEVIELIAFFTPVILCSTAVCSLTLAGLSSLLLASFVFASSVLASSVCGGFAPGWQYWELPPASRFRQRSIFADLLRLVSYIEDTQTQSGPGSKVPPLETTWDLVHVLDSSLVLVLRTGTCTPLGSSSFHSRK